MRRFIRSHKFVHRCVTHESQKLASECEKEAEQFVLRMREYLQSPFCDKDFILNMDQTAIYHWMSLRTIIDQVGARSINVQTLPNPLKRVTVTVTVAASGKKLPGMVVFKGKPNGRIAQMEFQTYGATYSAFGKYTCQEKAWMDERVMRLWVDKVLAPYLDTAHHTFSQSCSSIPTDAT